MRKRRVVILGATGSIGESAQKVARDFGLKKPAEPKKVEPPRLQKPGGTVAGGGSV